MQWSSEKKGPSLTLSADSTTATGATQSLRGQQALAPDGGSYSVKISLVSSPAEKGTGLGAGTYVGVCSDAFTNFAARYDDVRDATEAVWAVQDLHDEDDQATCVAPWKQHLNAHGRVFGHDETVTITRDGGTLYFQRDNGERVVAFRDLPLGPLYPFVHLDSKNVSATITPAPTIVPPPATSSGLTATSAPVNSNAAKYDAFLEKIEKNRVSNPNNLCARHLTRSYFRSFDGKPDEQQVLYKCALSGAENADSGVGAYIMAPDNLVKYRDFFDPLIRDYHKAGPKDKHVTDWELGADAGEKLDLAQFGLEDV
eukprot:PhM_4_TR18712/c0_g1_i3/m.62261